MRATVVERSEMLTRTAPRLLLVGVLACTLAAVPVTADPPAAARAGSGITVRDLGTLPGDSWSVAVDVNEHGQVIGFSQAGNGDTRGFLWDRGVMRDLGTFSAVAINDSGQVVGTALNGSGAQQAAMWDGGRLRYLTTPDGAPSRAVLLNEHGQVVVQTREYGGDEPDRLRNYVWDDGAVTEIPPLPGSPYMHPLDINDQGWVTGYSPGPGSLRHGFLWRDGVVTDLGSAASGDVASTMGLAVNEAGQVAGQASASDTEHAAAVWQDGEWMRLGHREGWSGATDINEHGTVVGWASDGGPHEHAVLYRDGEWTDLAPAGSRAIELNDRDQVIGSVDGYTLTAVLWQDGETHLLPPLYPGSATTAYDISERGQVAGSARVLSGVEHAVLWTTARGS
ncbi:hypothetical protein [Cellulomonas flavigena]|nr:hypothetical protein [Cellulomonas flavigena]